MNALIWMVCKRVCSNKQIEILTFGVFVEKINGEYTIERVALVMNIVPCHGHDLTGQA